MPGNDLMQYFIATGMTPEVAAQLASKVSVMAPPSPPIANGIKIDPRDGVQNLLTSRYGMNPQQAATYAGDILSGRATGAKELQAEAMTSLGNQEKDRLRGIQTQGFKDRMRAGAQMEKPFDDAMAGIGRVSAFARAAKLAPEDRAPGQQRIMDRVMGMTRRQMEDAVAAHGIQVTPGPVTLLPNDIQAGPAHIIPKNGVPGQYVQPTSPDDAQNAKTSMYMDNIRSHEAMVDKMAADQYREKLRTDKLLGPPGPGPD